MFLARLAEPGAGRIGPVDQRPLTFFRRKIQIAYRSVEILMERAGQRLSFGLVECAPSRQSAKIMETKA